MEYALRLSLQLALFGWAVWFASAVDRTPLRYRPFRCRSNGWSVSETFRCDSFRHCLDGSDEQGCQEAQFVQLPPENVTLTVGDLLNLTCVASGVPAPSIDWKMNGKLPGGDCDWSTEGGVGQLSCRLRLIDAGNYSCTARQPSRREIESRGTMVNVTGNACREGYFRRSNKVVLRIHESNFRHQDGKKASRDDLMIVLAYINLFLVRMYPTNGTYAPSSTDIVMDSSTDLGYHGLGKTNRIEECRCPHGYRGRSCERCDFGYNRANRYLATGICMPWEWHREEYYKVSTSTTMRNYHYHQKQYQVVFFPVSSPQDVGYAFTNGAAFNSLVEVFSSFP
ncbi:hypothetical protein quinque_007865 [Culex quinquefasciatus]